MNNAPFTIYEADVALYAVDGLGVPVDQIWIGESQERLILDGNFQERAVEYHGAPSARIYHEAESYSVEIGNSWQHDQSASKPRMPVLRRNQAYALVVVWFDRELGIWNKRLYGGVKAQPLHIEGVAVEQTMRLRAETMVELAGIGDKPDLAFAIVGEVVYRNEDESTLLYTYDFDAQEFAVVDPARLIGRAELDFTTPDELNITIGGDLALRATDAGVQVNELIGQGGTFLDDSPRLEFRRGARTAALSQGGRLAVANAVEQATSPAIPGNIEMVNPGWLFSLSAPKAYAPEFLETLEIALLPGFTFDSVIRTFDETTWTFDDS